MKNQTKNGKTNEGEKYAKNRQSGEKPCKTCSGRNKTNQNPENCR